MLRQRNFCFALIRTDFGNNIYNINNKMNTHWLSSISKFASCYYCSMMLLKSLILARNRYQSHPIWVGNRVFCGVGVTIRQPRGLFLFNKRKGRLPCSDEILLPIHACHHKAKIARWQVFGRVESQRSRFERAVIVKLRFRFTKRSALVERNKRKPSKDAHWHLRYRLQGDVRCESFSRYVCNMADTRQSVHV